MDRSEQVKAAIAGHLATELGDDVAGFAEALWACGLDWTAPTVPPQDIATIVAFTFGNRMQPNGNRLPGPVNERLADTAVALHHVRGARVFAQWEIAQAIGGRIPETHLVAIYPARDEQAEPVYLSTSGVVAEIARAHAPATLGAVGVVAFADHLFRCVQTARRFGFAAAAPEGVAMPRQYDAQSGQPWCRSRLAYLLHDMLLRVTECRAIELERIAR